MNSKDLYPAIFNVNFGNKAVWFNFLGFGYVWFHCHTYTWKNHLDSIETITAILNAIQVILPGFVYVWFHCHTYTWKNHLDSIEDCSNSFNIRLWLNMIMESLSYCKSNSIFYIDFKMIFVAMYLTIELSKINVGLFWL